MDIEELLAGGREETPELAQPEETPEDSPAETVQPESPEGDTEKGAETEKPEPFHKNPRWQKIQTENRELRERLDRLEKAEPQRKTEEEPEAPTWFVTQFGDDPKVWSQYLRSRQSDKEAVKAEVLREINSEREAESRRTAEYQQWVDDEVDSLRGEGLKFDRNRLMKIAVEYRPTDDRGQVDFRKAYDIMRMLDGQRKKSTDAVRENAAAAASPERAPSAESKRGYFTPDDLD